MILCLVDRAAHFRGWEDDCGYIVCIKYVCMIQAAFARPPNRYVHHGLTHLTEQKENPNNAASSSLDYCRRRCETMEELRGSVNGA